MARKQHTTELGCIACEELSDLGAGKEGWLIDTPNLLTSLHSRSLALSNQSLILIISWDNDFSSSSQIRLSLSPSIEGHISALEWLVFDDIEVVSVGTSNGYFLVFSVAGDLIHKQFIYPARITKLGVRGTRKDLMQETLSEEVSLVMPGVIARFDVADLQNMLRQWFQETQSDFWDQKKRRRDPDEFDRIHYQIWNVSKYGSCADAAITGIMPPPLMELQTNFDALSIVPFNMRNAAYGLPSENGNFLKLFWYLNSAAFIVGQSSQRYYCAVTVGEDAVISAYRLSEDRSRSLVGAIISKVVPAAFSTIASVSKVIWRSDSTSSKNHEVKPQPFAKAAPLTCLKDHPRKGEKLTLSPSGTLAAITDSLGRILLLDTQALVVVRLWKGYRDASCLFMEMLVDKDAASSSSTYSIQGKGDYSLCLAIHAPRKGIVEVWQMRTGPRLLTIQCARGSKILQPACGIGSSSVSSSYVPLEVFLLNGDSGQISVLNRALH
ncbi:Rab3-GAP regulatory subunit, N-terminal [Dillenia turbinata]|uniref:Rab3-GAP regulatory subunit, N-terminal n=1 Tax=Dillenia turbinata TaxID=194707 RepID=A0AAN8W615_9MAGN